MLNQLTKLILTVLSGSDVSAGDMLSPTELYVSELPQLVTASGTDIVQNKGTNAGTIVIIILVLLVFLAAMILMEAARSKYVLSVNRKNVTLPDLPKAFDGVKIALIGDLHQMEFGEYNTLLARKIKLEEPDYIFFAGDMGDSNSYSVDAFYDLLEALGSDIPLIIVPGNHDLRLGGGKVHKNVVDEIVSNGALLLDNTCAQIALGEDKIYVYGFCPELEKKENVDIKQWGFERVSEGYMRKRLGDCPKDAPVLLLTHDPAPFSAYAKWGASLVMAGHVHGGTVRLPLIGGLFSPNKSIKPRYSAGEYKLGRSTMFVTRGLGSDRFVRFGNPPEISLLTITRKPVEDERRALMSGADDDLLGISKEVVERTRQHNKDAAQNANNPFKELLAAIKRGWKWLCSEARSIKELLNERTDQLRDTIDDKRGVEKNRYAKEADRRKSEATYLSPANRAKENAKRVRDGGDRAMTDTPAEHYQRIRQQQMAQRQKSGQQPMRSGAQPTQKNAAQQRPMTPQQREQMMRQQQAARQRQQNAPQGAARQQTDPAQRQRQAQQAQRQAQQSRQNPGRK